MASLALKLVFARLMLSVFEVLSKFVGVRGHGVADSQTACRCLEDASGKIPGIKPGDAAGLSKACNINIGNPISTSFNYNTVN